MDLEAVHVGYLGIDPQSLGAILDAVPDPLVVITVDHRLCPVNSAARQWAIRSSELPCYQVLHGRSRPCRGSCPLRRVRQTGRAVTLQHKHRGAAGELRTVEVAASPLPLAGRSGGIVASLRDVTERARKERRLADRIAAAQDRARRDPLTGLLHRNAFLRELDRALERAKTAGGMAAVGFVDLDDFKQINDEHGHEAGDVLLEVFAARLRELVRESDALGRLGGDEFAILIEGVRNAEDVLALGRDLLADLCSGTTRVLELDLRLRASLGIGIYPWHAIDRAALLREADRAMYRAKRAGGSRVALAGWDPAPPLAILDS